MRPKIGFNPNINAIHGMQDPTLVVKGEDGKALPFQPVTPETLALLASFYTPVKSGSLESAPVQPSDVQIPKTGFAIGVLIDPVTINFDPSVNPDGLIL